MSSFGLYSGAAVVTVPLTGLEMPLEILVLGLVTGLTYALLALSLALTFRISRVLNFAAGEMGALAATLLPFLVLRQRWSYWLALPVSLATAIVVGFLVERFVVRRLAAAPRLIVLVATIGVAQALFSLGMFVPRVDELSRQLFPTPFDVAVPVGSLRLGAGHLMILFLAPLIAGALALFLHRTKTGLASRAIAENPDAARLAGVRIHRVSLMVWILAALLAGLAAVLVGPTRPIVSIGSQVALGPLLLLRALAAAMIGGLTDLSRVFAAGIAIGVVEALVVWNYPSGELLELILFGIIVASLLFQRRLVEARPGDERTGSLAGVVPTVPSNIARIPVVGVARRAAIGLALATAVFAPLPLPGSTVVKLSLIVVMALAALSLVVLTGMTGQVSLGQFAFVGLGALVGGRLAQLAYPTWSSMLYATVAGGIAALIIGLPALRLRGLYLAVTTLGFAVASATWLFAQPWLVQVSGASSSLNIPRPVLIGVDLNGERAYYWFCLLVFTAVALGVYRLRQTGVGRSFTAVRDQEAVAASLSISPRRTKLIAFVLSGMIAALAGYLYGGLLVRFSDLNVFSPEQSVQLLMTAIIGGITTITGAVLGALFVYGVPLLVDPVLGDLVGPRVQLLLSGFGVLIVVLQFPGGLAGQLFRFRDWTFERLARHRIDSVGEDDTSSESDTVGVALRDQSPRRLSLREAGTDEMKAPLPLIARSIEVRFGGHAALRDVSLKVNTGEILGLIGPNGAGKTTLFDVLSGQRFPDSGSVILDGEDITDLRPEHRARLGLGRSFQKADLFPEMTIMDSIKVALEREAPSEIVPSLLGLPPSRRAETAKASRAAELIEVLGLQRFAHQTIAELSTGTRRIAELGCIVALGAHVLLLDEPTAGIAQREVEAFQPVLRDLRSYLGATMVVIDHDMPMMMELADRVYALAAGQVIADGPPALVRDNSSVVAAYLGTDERAIARSGRSARVRPLI